MIAAESADALIWAAYLAAFPATIGALAAWRAAAAARRQTRPFNGATLTETVEKTQRDVAQLKQDLQYHIVVQHGRGPVPAEEVTPR